MTLRSGREELEEMEGELGARATSGNPWHCRTISEHYLICLARCVHYILDSGGVRKDEILDHDALHRPFTNEYDEK